MTTESRDALTLMGEVLSMMDDKTKEAFLNQLEGMAMVLRAKKEKKEV